MVLDIMIDLNLKLRQYRLLIIEVIGPHLHFRERSFKFCVDKKTEVRQNWKD